MSTMATIKFTDGRDEFFVHRHSDGFPETVIPEVQRVIDQKKGAWSEPECGLLVSSFLGILYKDDERFPDYMMGVGYTGDESFIYLVEYNKEKGWVLSVGVK